MYNRAPTYYQPNVVPQNPLNGENMQLYNEFIAKLVNPFTPLAELKQLYMLPVPRTIGQIRMTIERHKNGFNRIWPKYTLVLSDGAKFLLSGKKRGANATSNYLISLDQEKLDAKSQNCLGKVRSNFLGTEFYIFDTGKNPSKNKSGRIDDNRCQHGVVQYETNVLGSKGPRRMKVFLPNVDSHGKQALWRQTTDVSKAR
jgi:tubby and related proteins